ncbi:MAG: extracellular solute-binding protein [Chloroflexi bacterium]|nr:extracellular solute-binding protein [Chloroflexota bacterium]
MSAWRFDTDEVRGISRRRVVAAGMAAMAVGPLAAACSPLGGPAPSDGAKQRAEIEFWSPWTGPQYEGPTGMIARIDEAFTAKNPQITVSPTTVPGGQMVTKLVAAAAGGTPPDVLILTNGNGEVYSLAHQGQLGALQDVAGKDLGQMKGWMHPSMWDLGLYQGKLYALPLWSQGYALMWHKAHFREMGLDPEKLPARTLEEVPELGLKLNKAEGGAGSAYTRVGFWDVWFGCCPQLIFPNYLPAFGGQLLDASGAKVTANHPNNVKALEWLVGVLRRFDLARVTEFQSTFGQIPGGAYLAGRFSMWRDGPWRLSTIKQNNLRFDDYGISAFPDPAGMPGGFAYHYGDIPVIPKEAKQAAAAWRFVRFLTGFDGEETYAELLRIQPQIPISEKFTKGKPFQDVLATWPGYDVWINAFFRAKHVMTPPKAPTAKEYIDTLKTYLTQAFKGELTPRDALQQATVEAQRQLDASRTR